MSNELLTSIDSTTVQLESHIHHLNQTNKKYSRSRLRLQSSMTNLFDSYRKSELEPPSTPSTNPIPSIPKLDLQNSKNDNQPLSRQPSTPFNVPSPRITRISRLNSARISSRPIIDVLNPPPSNPPSARPLHKVRPFVPPAFKERSWSVIASPPSSPKKSRASLLTPMRRRKVWRKLWIVINVVAVFKSRGNICRLRREGLSNSLQLNSVNSKPTNSKQEMLFESLALSKAVLAKDMIFQVKMKNERKIKEEKELLKQTRHQQIAKRFVDALPYYNNSGSRRLINRLDTPRPQTCPLIRTPRTPRTVIRR
ncbi:hypothetical protein P9112_012203 [Eukaryota sp. TZLM1-RC]